MDFVEYSAPAGYDSGEHSAQAQAHFKRPNSTGLGESQKSSYYNGNSMPSGISCEIKPRLTKEQHDLLEKEYNKQHKPNTATKKRFADQLGVSLDKVNNWFQNRRAKSKQDAKKAAGALNLFNTSQSGSQLNFSSDSEVSPAFSSADYSAAMQQFTADDSASNGLGIDMQQYQDHNDYFPGSYHGSATTGPQPYLNAGMSQQMSSDMFDSPQEFNRRTLTQEQFDAAYAQQASMASMMNGSGMLDDYLQSGVSSSQLDYSQYFSGFQGGQMRQESLAFSNGVPAPLSSNDSSIPSEHSASTFASNSSLHDHGSISTNASSEWTDSRSSSVSVTQAEDSYAPHKAVAASTSQWQPGQSVPVDFNALSQEFKQVAQARQSLQQPQASEQPLAWPSDDAYSRRDSQTSSMLAQSMSHVGIHTPHPQQSGPFKTPAPPTSIAARRQRPRPAMLGLASMRSQSYSGAPQPGSPGQSQQHSLNPGQPLRRIRSTNLMNGVAQGRVQKMMPGAPQRSPLAFSFSDAVHSPKAVRHSSMQAGGNLAPPTPLSPHEFPRHDQQRQYSNWHGPGHVSRQPSISETDVEHGLSNGLPYVSAASVPLQNFSSPPHTPMYQQMSFVQQRLGSNAIIENTPPQSAPASQQTFPSNHCNVSQPQFSQAPSQNMQLYMQPQAQQFMNVIVPEQYFQTQDMNPPQAQSRAASTTSASSQYNGVTVVNAQGQLEYVPQASFLQEPAATTPPPQAPHMHTPPQGGQYITFSSVPPPPTNMQVACQVPKQPAAPAELFVHEYSPPAEMKRAATPRKTVDNSGPKNYSFANSTPEHFEEKRKKTDTKASASNSPASSSGAASSS